MKVLDQLKVSRERRGTLTVSKFIDVVAGWYGIERLEALDLVCQWCIKPNALPLDSVLLAFDGKDLDRAHVIESAMVACVLKGELHNETRIRLDKNQIGEFGNRFLLLLNETRLKFGELPERFKPENIFNPRFGDLAVNDVDLKAFWNREDLGEIMPWDYPAMVFEHKPYVESCLGEPLNNGDYMTGLINGEWDGLKPVERKRESSGVIMKGRVEVDLNLQAMVIEECEKNKKLSHEGACVRVGSRLNISPETVRRKTLSPKKWEEARDKLGW